MRPILRHAFELGADASGFLHLFFDLEGDHVADGVVGQIEERVDHVRIDSEQDDVVLVEDGGVVAVPDVFRDLHRGLVELLGRGLGMVVHPVPDAHIDQRDAGDFVGAPEVVQGFFGLAFGVGCGQAE